MRAAHTGPATSIVAGREAYLYCAEGVGRSRLTPAFIEKHVGVRGIARNWNTVEKLPALVGQAEGCAAGRLFGLLALPFRVEGAVAVRTLVGMRAEVIPLGLDEIGG